MKQRRTCNAAGARRFASCHRFRLFEAWTDRSDSPLRYSFWVTGYSRECANARQSENEQDRRRCGVLDRAWHEWVLTLGFTFVLLTRIVRVISKHCTSSPTSSTARETGNDEYDN